MYQIKQNGDPLRVVNILSQAFYLYSQIFDDLVKNVFAFSFDFHIDFHLVVCNQWLEVEEDWSDTVSFRLK